MFFVYILRSGKDHKLYTGFTNDLKRRVWEHNHSNTFSTRGRLPLHLIYYEYCVNKEDAIARERFLKTGRGKKYIKMRLKNFLNEGL